MKATRTVAPVTFKDVTKSFQKGRGKDDLETFNACEGLTFTVEEGEVVAILGETGSGKSTALGLLLGLIEPTNGEIRVVGAQPFREFDKLKGRVAIVFQEDRLMPWRTALENVTLGLEIVGRGTKAARKALAAEWLARVGLSGFEGAYPYELSGGMRQRVAIARAFALEPELLIGDETFSALDEITAADIRNDLIELIEQTGRTTVFVTHSVTEAVDIAQRVLVFGRPAHVIGEVNVKQRLEAGATRASLQEDVRTLLRTARFGSEVDAP